MEEAGFNVKGGRDGWGSGLLDQVSSKYEQQPPKFIRTDTFPYRMFNSADDTAGFRVIPPLYPSLGANIINGGGPTAFFYNPSGGVICDASFVKDTIKSEAAMGMSGGGSLVGMNQLRYPSFTPTQWQELKRQALIYKHFVSSSPIPPDLLSDHHYRAHLTIPPLYPTLGRSGVDEGGYFNLRFTNNTDPEPGRCRRTDGKKWRCSRGVASDQKYCERHLHRGRPRSRKPVEQRQRTISTVAAADSHLFPKFSTVAVPKTADSPKISVSVDPAPAISHFNFAMTKPSTRGHDSPGSIRFPFLSMVPEKEPRYSGWMNGGGDLEEMHSNNYIGLRTTSSTPPLLRHHEENLNPNYHYQNNPCYTVLNPALSSLDEYQPQDHLSFPPQSFTEAWSNEKPTAENIPSPPPSHLTLSMSNNANVDSSTHQIQRDLGIMDFESGRSHSLNWMKKDVALSATRPGGPLAEVLQTGTATSSPRNSNDDVDGAISGSTYTGLMNLKGRSPNEDSPTFVAGSRRSEMCGLPWMSLSK